VTAAGRSGKKLCVRNVFDLENFAGGRERITISWNGGRGKENRAKKRRSVEGGSHKGTKIYVPPGISMRGRKAMRNQAVTSVRKGELLKPAVIQVSRARPTGVIETRN